MFRISLENSLGWIHSQKTVVILCCCCCFVAAAAIVFGLLSVSSLHGENAMGEILMEYGVRMNGVARNVFCVCCVPNRWLLNAHCAFKGDLIKMCESMTIITPRLDKYLPIEYFNECYFARQNTPDSITFSRIYSSASRMRRLTDANDDDDDTDED